MSGSTGQLNVYTIEVGTAGTFTNDATIDVAATINAELKAAPVGATIKLVFNPGSYGAAETILLPSNTTVIGNDSTLTAMTSSGASLNGSALMANADAYDVGNNLTVTNNDGTTSYIPYNSSNTETMGTNASGAVIDSNISIQGMTFNETGNTLGGATYSNVDQETNVFGTWITNAKNIDIQNNVYIGGNDGNAFVNVVNGVVANNIAVGQMAAYDNWNGPVNITIEDNSTWQYSIDETSGAASTQINSTPTGDPSNPGNSVNDAEIGNLYSGNSSGLSEASIILPLAGYGPTLVPTSQIVVQGNIDSALNTPNVLGFYISDAQGSTTQDNLISQTVEPTGTNVWGGAITNPVVVDVNAGTYTTSHGTISGNLVLGDYTASETTPIFQVQGIAPNLSNNAVLGQSAYEKNAFSASSSTGNISNSGTITSGSGVEPELAILAIPTLFTSAGSTISLSGSMAPMLSDTTASTVDQVTLVTQFGTLSADQMLSGVNYETINGEAAIVLTGSLAAINNDLANLTYTANAAGWDDSIEIMALDSAGATATRYIPVLINNGAAAVSEVTTIASGFINPVALESSLYPGQALPAVPTLSGQILIASSGDNVITMGSTASLAFLGSGSTTLQGGSLQEFIQTGSGLALLNLNSTGDITVAGGAGVLDIAANTNAASVADFIEAGASTASIEGGAGSMTVAGGLGSISYVGGSGSTYLSTLPQDGGNLTADLGSGNTTIYALSGNASISSQQNTTNLFYLGIGDTSITSGGSDNIFAGSGNVRVEQLAGSTDTIHPGTGVISFIDDSPGNSVSQTSDTIFSSISIAGISLVQVSVAASDLSILQTARGDFISVNGSASVSGTDNIDTIMGGSGLLQYSGGAANGSAMIEVGRGGSSVVLTSGNDTVESGIGRSTVMASGTSSLNVTLGSGGGAIQTSSSGQSEVATTCNASDNISISQIRVASALINSAGNDMVTISGGFATVNSMTGSNDTINVANGTLDSNVGLGTAYGTSSTKIDVFDGIATISVFHLSTAAVFGEGSDLNFINQSILGQTVHGGIGSSITVSGGAGGGAYYGGSAGNNSLIGGAGAVTLVGGGIGDDLQANSAAGQNALIAGAGFETLGATSVTGTNLFVLGANSSDVVTTAGSGLQTFLLEEMAGSSSTITGAMAASSSNEFNFVDDGSSGGGLYTITNFLLANSVIYIDNGTVSGAPSCSITSIENNAAGMPLGASIVLSDHTTINLLGIAASSLLSSTASNGVISIW